MAFDSQALHGIPSTSHEWHLFTAMYGITFTIPLYINIKHYIVYVSYTTKYAYI